MIETVIFIPIYDINADFAALHSYDWLPSPEIKSGDPKIQYGTLVQARVKDGSKSSSTGKVMCGMPDSRTFW